MPHPALLFLLAALQQSPEAVLADHYRRVALHQGAWERGRACARDTARLYRQAGRDPAAAARVYAERFAGDTSAQRVSQDACLAALTGGPTRLVPPPVPPAAAAALRPRRPPPFSGGAFGTYTWVFYADLALGTLLGLIAALFHTRAQSGGWRIVLTAGGGLIGGIIGGAVFLPFIFLAGLLVFFSPPEPSLVFGMTGIVLVGGFAGALVGFWARKRGTAMAVFKRRLGLKDR